MDPTPAPAARSNAVPPPTPERSPPRRSGLEAARGPGAGAIDPWTVIDEATVLQRWEGAWVLPGSEDAPRAGGWGTYRVLSRKGDVFEVWHSPWEHEERAYAPTSPCRLVDDPSTPAPRGVGKAAHWAVVGDDMGYRGTPVGYRRGKRAVVCLPRLAGTITVDEDGCGFWERGYGPWKVGATRCQWVDDRLELEWDESFMDEARTQRAVVQTRDPDLLVPEVVDAIGGEMRHFRTVKAAKKFLCGRKPGLCVRP